MMQLRRFSPCALLPILTALSSVLPFFLLVLLILLFLSSFRRTLPLVLLAQLSAFKALFWVP